MCQRCDYRSLIEKGGLDYTPNRFKVLEIVGNSPSPLSAAEIHETLARSREVNRVTVYRVLELLVERKIVERISAGDRSFRYGLHPNTNHPPHPHFFCTRCGHMECLNPRSVHLDAESLKETFPGVIDKVEVRLDGMCKNCLRRKKAASDSAG